MKAILKSLVLLSAIAVAAQAADWPRFRGPEANGISTETGINKNWKENPPEVMWKVAMNDDGYAGPAVADGKLYIIDHKDDQDIVRCLNLQTGEEIWATTYAEPGKSNFGFSRATPAIDGDLLYTISRSGTVNCLKVADGSIVWSRNMMKDFSAPMTTWMLACSPVIDGDVLILTPGGKNAGAVAVDKKTGKTIWQGGGSDKTSFSTPVIATINGKKQYLVYDAVGLKGVDPKNGDLLWSFPWKTGPEVNAAMPLVMGDNVFITGGYGHGCAMLKIDGEKVEKLWENKEMMAHFSSPIAYDGYIYGTGDPGFLMCLDPKTGKALWKQKGFEKGGIIVVDGTIIGLDGRSGDLIMVELTPKGYNELSRIRPLGGQSWTAPVIADGKLIVRNKQQLACLNVK